ncbi:MAG: hypothetical protein UHD09_06315 [Bifidobacterium sp.]|nr:hypothetical protein [Bifidobacterium sp.]
MNGKNRTYQLPMLLAAAIVALLVGLGIGIPIGHTAGKTTAAADTSNAQVAQDSAEYQTLSSDVEEAKATIEEAQGYDVEALREEHEQLTNDIAAKQEELDKLTAQVTEAEKDIVTNGTWQVGDNMKAGKYRATEDVTGMNCTYTVYIDEAQWTREYDRDILQFDAPQGGYPEFTAEDKQEVRIKNCPTFKRIG